MRYVDPDGREEYDSSMTEEQFKKIANGIVVTQDGFKATLNGKTWDETQKFFLDNPEGVIYRNPDEFGYNFYTNQGNDIPHEYNMYTTDMLYIYFIGKSLFSLAEKLIAKQITKEVIKSTGRTTANTLIEQLAMEQAKSSPEAGKILPIIMNDAKNGWYAVDGWVKMSQNINGVEIHYIWNTITKIAQDFKFK